MAVSLLGGKQAEMLLDLWREVACDVAFPFPDGPEVMSPSFSRCRGGGFGRLSLRSLCPLMALHRTGGGTLLNPRRAFSQMCAIFDCQKSAISGCH